jgi:hypothetical protein
VRPGRGFLRHDLLGLPECPYVDRWTLSLPRGYSLRLHRWLGDDDLRHPHDHPSWFVTAVLRGGYLDVGELAADGSGILSVPLDHLSVGSVRFRSALHRHSVKVDPGGATTLCLFSPETRQWGFWVDGRFRKRNRYFYDHGEAPCS